MGSALIIISILLVFTGTIIINSSSELKSKKSVSKVYVTRREYERIVEEIRTKELTTDRFKKISSFMIEHDKRKYLDIEELIFELVNNYDIKSQFSESKKGNVIENGITVFNELQRLVDSLDPTQLESNPYLKFTKNILDVCAYDCKSIIIKLRNQINFMELNNNITQIGVNMDIPEKTLELLPVRISEQVVMSCRFSEDEEVSCINLLDKENEHIYTDYNRYVSRIDKLATSIYYLQLSNLLSIYPENVISYYFNIFNCSQKHRFLSSFFITKGSESILSDKHYEISKDVKENISAVIGVSYEQLVNMSTDDIDKCVGVELGSNKGKRLCFKLNKKNHI